jgi:hypothetical protein
MYITTFNALAYLRRLDRRLDRLRRLPEATSGTGATYVGLACVLVYSALGGMNFRRLLLRRTVLTCRDSISAESGFISEVLLGISVGFSLETSGRSGSNPVVMSALLRSSCALMSRCEPVAPPQDNAYMLYSVGCWE